MAVSASHLPSGEKLGEKSYALLAAVRLRALPLPSAATRNTSVLVVHAIALPPTRATYATVLPSGEMLTSSMPPNGWVGESVVCPGVRSRASSGFSGDHTNRCAYRPSSH